MRNSPDGSKYPDDIYGEIRSHFGGKRRKLQYFYKQNGGSEEIDDNIKTKQIFDKYKVLTKYCSIPYDNRENWCRLTIQPNITKENFIKELL